MDGVLVDFTNTVFRTFSTTLEKAVIPGTYHCLAKLGISSEKMWDKLNELPDFFANLIPHEWTHDLLSSLESLVGKKRLAILTSPGENGPYQTANCAAGKVRWVYEHIPEYAGRLFLGKAKHMCASPYHVLIDDSDKKINDFRAAGGHGLLFPQLWNSAHIHSDEDRVAYVKDQLSSILKFAIPGPPMLRRGPRVI